MNPSTQQPTPERPPLTEKHVLVLGEALIDVVDGAAHVGGSPLNVAVGMSRLGYPTHFAGRFGSDEYGDMIAGHLHLNGVRSLLAADSYPTSVATTTLDDDGAASYEFQLHWDIPDLAKSRPQALERARALHTGSLAVVLAPGAARVNAAVAAARRAGALISFDPNCRPSITTDKASATAAIEALVRLSDLVKASDEDLHWLYPTRTVEASAAAWRELGPTLLVVTRGPRGATGFITEGHVDVQAHPVAVVDTVGAGDSFMAALLSGILDLEEAVWEALTPTTVRSVLESASAAAAITVTRRGADPPTKHQLRLEQLP